MRRTAGLTLREREQIVLAHAKWTMKIVRERARHWPWLWPDLCHDALLALWMVSERYHPEQGAFSTFARPHVWGVVLLNLKRMLCPVGIGDGSGKRLDLADIPGQVSLETTYVKRSRGNKGLAANWTLKDTVRDESPSVEETLGDLELPRVLARAISTLPPRERMVMDARLAGRTTTEIARRLGVSHQRVTQLWAQGVRRVRALDWTCGIGTSATAQTRRPRACHPRRIA